jgi:sulfur carrier protein
MQLHAHQAITLLVNGETVETCAATLAELIAERGFAEGAVATALNGEFVPRGARSDARIAANDRIEIVAPRQGG